MNARSEPFVPGAILTAHIVANFSVAPDDMDSLNTRMASGPARSTSQGMFLVAGVLQGAVLPLAADLLAEGLALEVEVVVLETH
jgi:hypothetical protein